MRGVKYISLVAVLLVAELSVAQLPQQRNATEKQAAPQQICGAPAVNGGPESELVASVFNRLNPSNRYPNVVVVLVNSSGLPLTKRVNAWAVPSTDLRGGVICITTDIVHFVQDAPGELAFVIGHEAAHTLDNLCVPQRLAGERIGAARRAPIGSGRAAPVPLPRAVCEYRADTIGFELLTAAGFSPYAAGGFLGRLEMFAGGSSTAVLSRLMQLGSSRDYPITADRISHMRRLIAFWCRRHGECQ